MPTVTSTMTTAVRVKNNIQSGPSPSCWGESPGPANIADAEAPDVPVVDADGLASLLDAGVLAVRTNETARLGAVWVGKAHVGWRPLPCASPAVLRGNEEKESTRCSRRCY
jgi:hypothetical protein